MDEEVTIPKCLRSYSFRSVTPSGNLAKTYVHVFVNGVTSVIQLILSKEESVPTFTKVYTKLGYSLYSKSIGFKYDSLMTLAVETSKTIKENNIDPKDII